MIAPDRSKAPQEQTSSAVSKETSAQMANTPIPAPRCSTRNLTNHELEQDMQRLLPHDRHVEKTIELTDAIFDSVSNLLSQAGREEWSMRPRTFVVLWIICVPELMEDFVRAEAWDIALPYAFNSLPESFSASQRHQFLKTQEAVLTKAAKIEEGSESAHASFGCDAEAHLESIEIIGEGASGSVDRVRSKLSRKIYARKTMKRSALFEKDQKALNRFRKEIASMRKLHHRHLVRYIGSYTDPVHVGILMEPLAECDMRTFLNRPNPTIASFNCIRQAFGCLCTAIIYLQEQSIRHKDIKPENILVNKSKVFITDFGLARDWTEKGRSTTEGVVNGRTYAYAAPEVLDQVKRSTSSDVWSLGCVFLDMVTVLKGKRLIDKQDFFETNGSFANCPAKNQEAYKGWMKELKSDYENHPLEWITNMCRMKRESRLTPQSLLAQIMDCDDDKRYYGRCCEEPEDKPLMTNSEDEDGPSSDVDSEDEEATGKKKLNLNVVERRLCNAAKTGDITSASGWLRRLSKHLAKEGKSRSSFTTRSLNEAARTGNEEVAELLIKFGFNLEQRWNGQTPLLTAAANSHEGMVELLVKHKANINAQDAKEGNTALHYASEKALTLTSMPVLLRNRAAVNIRNRLSWTPLMLAATKYSPAVVKLLLHYRANPSLRDPKGFNALHLAATMGLEKIMIELLAQKMDIDDQEAPAYNTALHCATRSNRPLIVKLLLERGANVNVQQKGGHHITPVHLACSLGNCKVLEVLLRWNPNLGLRDIQKRTPLDVASQAKHKDALELLLKAGANPNNEETNGPCTFWQMMSLKNLDLAQVLLDHGADIDRRGRKGETVLHYVAGLNEETQMQFMLDNHADIEATDSTGMTPLMVAAVYKCNISLGMLLDNGANVHAKLRAYGITALHMAVRSDSIDAVSMLLAFGADPLARTLDGHLPVNESYHTGNTEIRGLLTQAMSAARKHFSIEEQSEKRDHRPAATQSFDPRFNSRPEPDLRDQEYHAKFPTPSRPSPSQFGPLTPIPAPFQARNWEPQSDSNMPVQMSSTYYGPISQTPKSPNERELGPLYGERLTINTPPYLDPPSSPVPGNATDLNFQSRYGGGAGWRTPVQITRALRPEEQLLPPPPPTPPPSLPKILLQDTEQYSGSRSGISSIGSSPKPLAEPPSSPHPHPPSQGHGASSGAKTRDLPKDEKSPMPWNCFTYKEYDETRQKYPAPWQCLSFQEYDEKRRRYLAS